VVCDRRLQASFGEAPHLVEHLKMRQVQVHEQVLPKTLVIQFRMVIQPYGTDCLVRKSKPKKVNVCGSGESVRNSVCEA